MLKKITFISAVVLVVCLIAGTVLIPLTIRDFLQNGDRFISKFFNSTPVSSFDASGLTTLELNFNDMEVYIEPSNDDHLYLRVEGLFADQYTLSDYTRQAEGKNILSVSIDRDALFFDTGSLYLLRSGLSHTSTGWVIVRIPSWISVETTGSPWRIRLVDNVPFQNRNYYEEHLWNTEDIEKEQEYQELSLYRSRFNAMKAAFESELQKNLVQLDAKELSLSVYNSRVEETVETHLGRMEQQLFPDASGLYDINTLTTLLENYFELYGSAMKQQGLVHESEMYSDDYHERQNRYSDLRDAADMALDEFLDYYEGYLSDLQGRDGLGLETEEPEEIEILKPEEEVLPPLSPLPDLSSQTSAEYASSSEEKDVLSAPSVYSEAAGS